MQPMMINFHDLTSDSLFTVPLMKVATKDNLEKILKNVNALIKKYYAIADDRALSIVGALVVEKEIDNYLSSWLPKYKRILNNTNFTFSMKVDIVLSTNLIPARIINCIDPIRKIRNEFAHNLDLTTFKDAKKTIPSEFESIYHKLKIFLPFWDKKDDRETFKQLILYVSFAINFYSEHVSYLQKFIWKKENINKIFEPNEVKKKNKDKVK